MPHVYASATRHICAPQHDLLRPPRAHNTVQLHRQSTQSGRSRDGVASFGLSLSLSALWMTWVPRSRALVSTLVVYGRTCCSHVPCHVAPLSCVYKDLLNKTGCLRLPGFITDNGKHTRCNARPATHRVYIAMWHRIDLAILHFMSNRLGARGVAAAMCSPVLTLARHAMHSFTWCT